MDETYTQALEKKLAACESGIVAGSASGRTFYEKAAALYKLERYQEALVAAEEARQLEPERASIYRLKGVILIRLQRLEGALFALEKAVQLDPADLASYKNKGRVLLTLQRYEEALPIYQTIQQLDPSDTYAPEVMQYLQQVKRRQRVHRINYLYRSIGRLYYGLFLGGIGLAMALMALRVNIFFSFIIIALTLGAFYILASKVYR
ncbi:tetratricopeptide repeat protein [Dictyobacter formicarum]|uniref:Tetratricopeptide repeat protein n=1 Tax=Dictyobacter formicarum TaxID=2778368 RepID=A0ABQ3VT07_9CHLR|nr:tetratricopeptide repeat protein [Dictyobacter formicarum]GHO88834.1 hypothetical protein KSZ_68400 [Dictyobacter formicarum]